MAENKTKLTELGPEVYLTSIADPDRRRDCEALIRLMTKVSKQEARMWGSSIVGFGTHRYKLASGKVGEICAVGFSSRRGDIAIYGVGGENADPALLANLGKYKRGKGCLYVSRMADVDLEALEQLVAGAVRRRLA
jgi:hypothetical protein